MGTDTSVALAGGIEEEAGRAAVQVPRAYPVYPGFDPIRDRKHGDAIRRAEGSWVSWETPHLLSVRPRLPVQWSHPSASASMMTWCTVLVQEASRLASNKQKNDTCVHLKILFLRNPFFDFAGHAYQ